MIPLLCLTALALAAEVAPEAETVDVETEPTGPDRSGPPLVVEPEVLKLPPPEVHTLREGVEVLHVRVPGVRKFEVALLVHQGRSELEMGRHVEAALGWAIDAANAKYDPAALNELEDLHEIDVWSTMRSHYGVLAVDGPIDELDLAMEMFVDMVSEPTFPKSELKRYVRDQELYYLLRGPSRPRDVASALLAYGWFPPDHPYGERPDLDQFDEVKGKALLDTYGSWIADAPITVLSVGDMAYEDVAPALEKVLQTRGKAGPKPFELEYQPPTASRVLASHIPGQDQVTVRMRTTAPGRDSEGNVPAWAGSYVFGGHFLSRLNANLREEKGWTYGSRASLRRTGSIGNLTVSVDVKAENLAGTVHEIEGELQRLVDDDVMPAELELAQRRLIASWNETLASGEDAHDRYLSAIDDGEEIDDRRNRYLGLREVTPEQVRAVAEEHWGPDGTRLWVLVGDRDAMQPQLDELGWTVEWVAPNDAILGKVPAATP